ncbi:MAG: fumarylacetoacetate hydrolase family protein [Verrucomicrobiales bacterium]|nr:fumarylacetoacetate hydrolase family protein [Verrucomicrobiales bacterium]
METPFLTIIYFTLLSCLLQTVGNSQQKTSFEEFAKQQAVATQSGKPIDQFSVTFPDASITDAEKARKTYEAQLSDHKSFAGIKGAVVGKGGQTHFQIENPLSATLFREGWISGRYPEIKIRDGADPGIETEIGIVLKKPITEPVASIEELKTYIDYLVPVIELPAGRHNWSKPPTATDLIVANVFSDNYIVGDAFTDLSIDIDAVTIQLFRENQIINETNGGDANNGQWWNFLYQVNWAIANSYTLKPGNLVITGALGKINKTGSGNYRADFGKLGEITFRLVKL